MWVSKILKPKVQVAYWVVLTFEGGGVVAQAFLSLSLSLPNVNQHRTKILVLITSFHTTGFDVHLCGMQHAYTRS